MWYLSLDIESDLSSTKLGEAGRDYHQRMYVNHKITREKNAGEICTGGTTSMSYSSLNIEGDLSSTKLVVGRGERLGL